jgi:FkbM family methyltransferase
MSLKRRLRQFGKLIAIASNPVWRRALRRGAAAAVEHTSLLRGLDIATCVDIGANIGQFSLLIRGLFPTAQIFAFEPLKEPSQKYAHVMRGDERTRLFTMAVAPAREVRHMHVSARPDSSSLLPITDSQIQFAPGTEAVGTEVVTAGPLDSALQATDIVGPALLKLDVQGYELEALKGCRPLLGQFQYVYAELSFQTLYGGQALAHEIIAWLATEKFHLAGIQNPSYDKSGNILQADFLFLAAGAT